MLGVVGGNAHILQDQLEQLRSFPDTSRGDLIRYFTLTPADIAFVDPGRGHGPADRLAHLILSPDLAIIWCSVIPRRARSSSGFLAHGLCINCRPSLKVS